MTENYNVGVAPGSISIDDNDSGRVTLRYSNLNGDMQTTVIRGREVVLSRVGLAGPYSGRTVRDDSGYDYLPQFSEDFKKLLPEMKKMLPFSLLMQLEAIVSEFPK